VVPARQNVGRPAKGSGQSRKLGSGTGSHLPVMTDIQFEWNDKGGVEAWYSPSGAVKRSDKTYLVYIGKRKLHQIGTGKERSDKIRQIVSAKMTEKGITP
jgi:hypothetical protein